MFSFQKKHLPLAGVIRHEIYQKGLFLPLGCILTATGATNGLFLGDPAFFGFGNKPALSTDITQDARAGYGLPKTTEKLLL